MSQLIETMDNSLIVQQIVSAIGKVLAFDKFNDLSEQIVTDIYLQPVQADSVLNIYDDDDLLLAECCDGLASLDSSDFYGMFRSAAEDAIKRLKTQKAMDGLNIFQPFSFVLINDEREHLCDIDVIDTDTIVLNDKLLSGWENELDEFIEKLLAD